MEKLLLLFDSKKAQPISFVHIFFLFFFRVLIFAKYESFAYLACIYFRECRLKENFACNLFWEIDQNSRRYVHAKISTLKVIARGVRQGMDFWDFLTQKRFL